MKKEKIKNIVLIMIVAVISSTITSFATSNYLFDSIDVKYDNSNGVQAETVQGAIDELYSCASDYSEINNKINGYFQNNPTSYFNGETLRMGETASSNTQSGISLYYNNVNRGTLASFSDGITLGGRNSNGEWGKGELRLFGNPVKINGVDVSSFETLSITLNSTNIKGGSILGYKMGNICILNLMIDTVASGFPNWTDYRIATINGVKAKNKALSIYDPQSSNNKSGDLYIEANSNVLYASPRGNIFSNEDWLRGQIVFFCE